MRSGDGIKFRGRREGRVCYTGEVQLSDTHRANGEWHSMYSKDVMTSTCLCTVLLCLAKAIIPTVSVCVCVCVGVEITVKE